MAVLKLIPAEHWAILRNYLDGENGVIFLPEETLQSLPKPQAQALRDADGEPVDYNFGGEADLWADIMRPGSYCLDTVLDRLGLQPEE